MKVKDYDIYRKSFPYYKVQYWDDRVMAWHDIQKRFAYPDEANDYGAKTGKVFRLTVVYRGYREIYGQ